METTKMEFANWTEYDDWLMQNYESNSIFSVNEVDGKIQIEYMLKSDFAEFKKQQEEKKQG